MMRKLLLPLIILSSVLTALAQDSYTKMEAAVDYSYARFNPSHAYISNSFSLNGGGGSFLYNFTRFIGAKADFEGYGSATRSFTIPPGNICANGCSGNVQGNLFTYQFGPQIGMNSGKFRPWGHLLLGGAHSNIAGNLYTEVGNASARPSDNAFALSFGGGLDILVNQSGTIALRPGEFDYLWTNFNLNSHQSGQSNFQYKAGVVFNF